MVKRKYFGTDGVRGRVGDSPMTADFALRLAGAAARVLVPDGGTVVIGKDTRVSGYMFEAALEAGFTAAGVQVLMLGPLPTPGVAYITRTFGADLGVMISASHNPYFDNGIKFFDGTGAKLSDDIEMRIEGLLQAPAITRDSSELGFAQRIDSARERYREYCLKTVDDSLDLSGMKIALDCSNGAAFKVAPRVLSALGAEIVPIGCSPNGKNINDGCGSTQPELLQNVVVAVKADVGIALDGDGDRLLMVDHEGNVVDGDQLIYIVARGRHELGELKGPVVGTVMSNLGLERRLAEHGIDFVRAQVGDRYVMSELRNHGGIIGGESSGHIICLDKSTTGDGIVSALQLLELISKSGKTLAELAQDMPMYPQVLVNVRVSGAVNLDANAKIQSAKQETEEALGERGRVVLRASGTEPVIRVMVEGVDKQEVRAAAAQLADVVKQAAA
ncbi:MAG: phosphoglucosamine mutase [Pseudomonadota bacterium]